MNALHSTLAFWSPGPFEWVVIGIVAVLLFGKRLPEVGRNLGRGIVEFKKGLKEAKSEIEDAAKSSGQTEAKPGKQPDEKPSSTAPYDEADKS